MPKDSQIPFDFVNFYATHTRSESVQHFGVRLSIIRSWADRLGIRKINRRGSSILQQLTARQHEILTGCMLGDGSLRKPRTPASNSRFSVKHSVQQQAYLQWIHAELVPFSLGIDVYEVNDSFGPGRMAGTFDSVAIRPFTEMEQKWYLRDDQGRYVFNNLNRRIKVVPNDIALTPLAIAVWFYDDGCNRPAYRIAEFCSESFSQADQLRLVELLACLGVKARVAPVKKGCFRIKVTGDNYVPFIRLISDSIPVESMRHKVSLDGYTIPKDTRFKHGFDARRKLGRTNEHDSNGGL